MAHPQGRSRISGRHHLQCSGSGCCRNSWSSTRRRLSDASGRQVSPAARQQEPQSSAGAPGADQEERSRGHGQWVTKGENLSLQDGRCSKTGGEEKRKRATQTEFIVDATMQPIIARMMVTSEFSIWTELLVGTAYTTTACARFFLARALAVQDALRWVLPCRVVAVPLLPSQVVTTLHVRPTQRTAGPCEAAQNRGPSLQTPARGAGRPRVLIFCCKSAARFSTGSWIPLSASGTRASGINKPYH